MAAGGAIDPGLWGHAIPINGGEYEIVATAPDHAEWKQKIKIANERGDVTVTVPLLEETAKPKPKPDKPVAVKEKPQVAPQPTGVMSTKRGIAIGVGVIGVGAIVAGGLLGHSAQGQRDDAR